MKKITLVYLDTDKNERNSSSRWISEDCILYCWCDVGNKQDIISDPDSG